MYKIVLVIMIAGFNPTFIVDKDTIYSSQGNCTAKAQELALDTNVKIMKHQLKGMAFSTCIKLDEGQVI